MEAELTVEMGGGDAFQSGKGFDAALGLDGFGGFGLEAVGEGGA